MNQKKMHKIIDNWHEHFDICEDQCNCRAVHALKEMFSLELKMEEYQSQPKFKVGQKVFFFDDGCLEYKAITSLDEDGAYFGAGTYMYFHELYASQKNLTDYLNNRLKFLLKDENYD